VTVLLPAALGGAILAILGICFAAYERRAIQQQHAHEAEQMSIPFQKRA
jgi:hypothetical protein